MFFSREAEVNGLMTSKIGVIYFILDLMSSQSTKSIILLPPTLLIPPSIAPAS